MTASPKTPEEWRKAWLFCRDWREQEDCIRQIQVQARAEGEEAMARKVDVWLSTQTVHESHLIGVEWCRRQIRRLLEGGGTCK